MTRYYPLMVDLRDRRVLVVGGGTVAQRKVEGLLDAGACVTIVSPTLTAELAALAGQRRVDHEARGYRPGDAAGFSLADVRAVLFTHGHDDHYGLAGRIRVGADRFILKLRIDETSHGGQRRGETEYRLARDTPCAAQASMAAVARMSTLRTRSRPPSSPPSSPQGAERSREPSICTRQSASAR